VTGDAAAPRRPFPVAALGFAAAAALSSWNPLSAPFGLVVGLGALAIAVRALRAGFRRAPATGAIVLAAGAVVASGLVLALTAGVGRELGGTPIVAVPPRADVNAELDAAAERTRPARERARSELDALDGAKRDAGSGRKDAAPPPGDARPAGPAKP
jgi:hypothetical protein